MIQTLIKIMCERRCEGGINLGNQNKGCLGMLAEATLNPVVWLQYKKYKNIFTESTQYLYGVHTADNLLKK